MDVIETYTNQELVNELMKRHTFIGAILYNKKENRKGIKPQWNLRGSPGLKVDYICSILEKTVNYIKDRI